MNFSWRGYGLIVPLLLTTGTYALTKIFSAITDIATKSSMSLSFAIIGILLWYLGRQFIRNESLTSITENTGNQNTNKQKFDTFCSIHVKHWGTAAILLGFIIAGIDLIMYLF